MKTSEEWRIFILENDAKDFTDPEKVSLAWIVRLIQADAMETALKTAEALLRHSRVLFEQTGNPCLEHAAKAIAKERESLQ